MKKILLLLVMYCTYTQHITAQNIAINDNGAQPDSSALLDLQSTTKGFLAPRMTEAQRVAIPLPSKGLLVYQIDNDSGFYYHNGTLWTKLEYSAPTCKSIIPMPAFPVLNLNYISKSSNTTASIGQILVPFDIQLNEVTIIGHFNGGIPGRIKLALYTEDGQTKIFECLSDSLSSVLVIPMSISLNNSKLIHAGLYYLSMLPVNSTNISLATYFNNPISDPVIYQSGKNILQGTMPVPINTLPSIINPLSLSSDQGSCVFVKFN